MGRRALDDEARAGLEHTHPDLSFDWHSLVKEAASVKPAPAARPQGRESQDRATSAPLPPVVAVEDESDPGPRARASRSGAAPRAVRRSARSESRAVPGVPEERDQLVERLRRLNPDDWGNESAVRAGVSTVEAEWDAIAAALPPRRRGRRGGRLDSPTPGGEGGRRTKRRPRSPTSGIIAGDGDADARQEDVQMDRADRTAGDSGDDDRVGRPGPGDGIPGDD